ncbi:tripartite tricarboxylate transporter permease [Ancylobacter sp. A5.8]|uniref:tripartite tricarboxylate transporter permease n=1 Tax=Ancylobacter gelatini TaxID=2919920 RepID=UPI001F4D3ECA|nr:tripartite tricarboxylate transporter permease [Ancylobacter gelatini]MCJ8145196.1 tripartite tricarboxylate transporter permease [Ancylobacter gelatini]
MDMFIAALHMVIEPSTLLTLVASSLFGFAVGCLPGLTATMAVALLVPMTFFMSPIAAITSIVAASAMAIFAGDIPGALLRMPGTPASAAYVEDSHILTKRGDAGLVITSNAAFSAIGGIFGTLVLIVAAPALADFALDFSAYEFFWLGVLGLSCAVFVAGDDLVKGMTSLMFGLLIATVGMDYTTGHPRFTFGIVNLLEGVSFIPGLIGMFALPEILRSLLTPGHVATVAKIQTRGAWRKTWEAGKRYWGQMVGGSVLGTIIGALPGGGADTAAWISYAMAKKTSKEPEKFGKGHIEGIVAGSAANNAALSGAWIPAIVFAIPGDTITAIGIGVLYLKGVNPGPTVFINNGELFYAVFIVFILANLLMFPLGSLAMRIAQVVLRIPRDLILPALLVLSVTGGYAIDNDFFGIWILLGLGAMAYLMEENGFPIAPMVLGIVLGEIVEQNFMQALISSNGNLLGLFSRPIAGVLGAATIIIWTVPLLRWIWSRFVAAPGVPASGHRGHE